TLAACLERLRTEGETEDAPASSMDRAVSTEKLSAAELVPPPHDTHDTEPLATRLFFDSAPAESTAAADDAAEMAEVFGTTHTAPPVITATHTAPQREPSFVLSRRRALRRVAVAGAITGTLIGVALSLALDAPGRRSAGSRPANLGSAPSAPAVPVALAAPAPVNALTPPPTLVTAPPARNPPPVASAAARLPHKKPHASSSVPSEREVWIE
ncbi:MAG TPA: hypothetical protein VGQ57_07420, partial [Polyangiaceae bacterium]|nr:hypothetical protein [Polyangiaceae bacterium]